MASGKFISYIRVSTQKQGVSGLGLEAQQKAIGDFLNGGDWQLIGEYIEVESGKLDERPELIKALHGCKMTGATLIIAKLDRLSRDLHFITSIQKSKIEFVVCDMPMANPLTTNLMGAFAQYEREVISTRTKAALAAAKARGQVLGNPINLNEDAKTKGRVMGVRAIQRKADDFAKDIYPVIQEFEGKSLRNIAKELNDRKILTARNTIWTATAVKNVIDRQNRPA